MRTAAIGPRCAGVTVLLSRLHSSTCGRRSLPPQLQAAGRWPIWDVLSEACGNRTDPGVLDCWCGVAALVLAAHSRSPLTGGGIAMWGHGHGSDKGSAKCLWTRCAACSWWGYNDQIVNAGGVCGGCWAPLRTSSRVRRGSGGSSDHGGPARQVLAMADALPEPQKAAVVAALAIPVASSKPEVLETGAVSAGTKLRAAQRAVKSAQDAAVKARDAAEEAVAALARALAAEEHAQFVFAEETKLLAQKAKMEESPPASPVSRIQLSDLLAEEGEKRITIDTGATLDPDSQEFTPEDRERLMSLQREQEEAISKLLKDAFDPLNKQAESIKAEYCSKCAPIRKKRKALDGEPQAVDERPDVPNSVAPSGGKRPPAGGASGSGGSTLADGTATTCEPVRDKSKGDPELETKRAAVMQAAQEAKSKQTAAPSAATKDGSSALGPQGG